MAVGLRRAPLVALGIVGLFVGLWAGLMLLGVTPVTSVSVAEAHGPLMALGFLGTLISLERAVALGRPWAYAAPLAAALGALSLAAGAPQNLAVALLAFGGLVLLAAHAIVHRIQPTPHNTVMAIGAACWVLATAVWLDGYEVPAFAALLAGFLVLTIVGERLELSRVLRFRRGARAELLVAIAVFCVGLVLSLTDRDVGVRVAGVGLLGQAAWLIRRDVARRTIRIAGVTRFMAAALLAGYGWLAAGGVLWLVTGMPADTLAYDASLHAIFLGFIMSMVFAHAPVIIPAVLRVELPFHRHFYAHLILLHLSLLLRLIGGDAFHSNTAWQWGGSLNEVALLLFVVATATAVASAQRARRRASRPAEVLREVAAS